MRRPLALAVCLAGCAGTSDGRSVPNVKLDPGASVAVGAGSYINVLLPGEKAPSNVKGSPVQPKLASSFKGVPTSNTWWSSLIWQYDRGNQANPYSEPLYADPLVVQARAGGLGLGGPSPAELSVRAFLHPYHQDLLVGVEGLTASSTRVAGYGDWTVTARWEEGTKSLNATIGHGLPFAYFETAGGAAVIDLADEVLVVSETPGAVSLTVAGRPYGIFAPGGATWTREGKRLRSDLRGRHFFSIATLPDDKPATLVRFRKHAFAFVTGSEVSWRYDAAAAELRSTFTVKSELREKGAGYENTPLLALYPHQWKSLGRQLSGPTYSSPRGTMKVIASDHFETQMAFGGVLPVMARPAGGSFDAGTLASQIRSASRGDLFPAGLENTKGTYWTGKSLLRVSLLAWMAEQAGETEVRARLVTALEGKLEDWFDGKPPNLFSYDRNWATLIGLPSEYRSGWELNDHHFHYGQYVFAAATVARFDPAWAASERWGSFVDLLIKDCANTDRADRRFPFLRYFDAYAGHSWANGPSLFAEGNNEESSSEDANFATALILWGSMTGRTAVRDLGIFLHANLTTAVEQYWFNIDGDNFPKGFDKPAVAMVWGAGAKYDTWWDHNPIYVHGINFLPFTGGSLYLGRRPEYVRRNHAAIIKANHGDPLIWRDIIWMYQALADPAKALALLDKSPHFEPEFGNSRAFVYHWLHGLAAYGQVDTTVTADTPTYAVLRNGGTRHHIAFNPTATATKVRFSDGVVLELGPFEQKVASAPAAPATAAR